MVHDSKLFTSLIRRWHVHIMPHVHTCEEVSNVIANLLNNLFYWTVELQTPLYALGFSSGFDWFLLLLFLNC